MPYHQDMDSSPYYRIQHAGHALSRSWQSERGDGSIESGLSVACSLEALSDRVSCIYDCPVGAVDVIALDGSYLGGGELGGAGEACVIPTAEIARWHHPDFGGWRAAIETEQDLLDAGFAPVATMEVED
jgi:hypothetical protein